MKASELFEGEHSSLRKTYDKATNMTKNEEIIKEYEDVFRKQTIKDYAETERLLTFRQTKQFILSALEQKDKEWKERIMKELYDENTCERINKMFNNLDL